MKYNLDVKDKKILYELNKDSRQPISKLSKKLKLSKQSASYRINKLTETGIIKQFYTLINFTKLGYKPYKIFLRMHNLNKEEINKHLKNFRKKEYIVWTVHCDGKYDVILGLIAKNTKHFKEIYLDLLEKYSNSIIDSDHSTIISAHQRKKEYLSEKREIPILNDFYVDQETTKINKKDSEILKILAPNSRISLIDLSKKLKLTPEAIRIRIKNLKKNKIIMGSSILIDFTKLNHLSYKILFKLKNKNQEKINQLNNFLKNYKGILEIINVLGNWDIEIDLEVKSTEEFNDIITEIRNKFKDLILTHDTLIKYEEYSYNYYPIKN